MSIFVGAADETYPRVAELLEPLGSIRHVGAPGSGVAMKLVVNSMLGARSPGSAKHRLSDYARRPAGGEPRCGEDLYDEVCSK